VFATLNSWTSGISPLGFSFEALRPKIPLVEWILLLVI
jgi:hypothetical protein